MKLATLVAIAVAAACGRRIDGSAAPSPTGPARLDGSVGHPGAGDGAGEGSAVAPRPLSSNIVVDQFGYLPASEKIGVIRNPQVGFDRASSFTPGVIYALVDARSGERLFEAAPIAWNGGATDPSSGDQVWWFDFSVVTRPGVYFVLDEAANVRSAVFTIGEQVYREVLVQATRMFYYQRDGFAKDAKYAGTDWADGMAHPQDGECGAYSDGSATLDLHGGWFDAGDQDRFSDWGASDVIELLRAYVEAPAAFTDDTNIPESGNGAPDLLDEVKWEIDWLARMQKPDGAVLNLVMHPGTSPPSSDTSRCRYLPVNTSATLTSAAAFAFASIVFGSPGGATAAYPGYAAALRARAERAWAWAVVNPEVRLTLGAGEHEVDAATLLQKKLQAAAFLLELTGATKYRTVFDANAPSLLSTFDAFHAEPIDTALEYTRCAGATPSVVNSIKSRFRANIEGSRYFGVHTAGKDPYFAYLDKYIWGSNKTKADQGNLFADVGAFGIDPAASGQAATYAARYAHYVHGVNPLHLVYLSNMGGQGAESFVTRFFHTWFGHGTQWDAVGVSRYGPPPGYLTGGANPSYSWMPCCPAKCSQGPCGAAPLSPPAGQPPQKSYLDFNDGPPQASWEVTEPDDGYQAAYVRLLSKFVR
jgi:hypothetical protein